jgi:hypothetical protein
MSPGAALPPELVAAYPTFPGSARSTLRRSGKRSRQRHAPTAVQLALAGDLVFRRKCVSYVAVLQACGTESRRNLRRLSDSTGRRLAELEGWPSSAGRLRMAILVVGTSWARQRLRSGPRGGRRGVPSLTARSCTKRQPKFFSTLRATSWCSSTATRSPRGWLDQLLVLSAIRAPAWSGPGQCRDGPVDPGKPGHGRVCRNDLPADVDVEAVSSLAATVCPTAHRSRPSRLRPPFAASSWYRNLRQHRVRGRLARLDYALRAAAAGFPRGWPTRSMSPRSRVVRRRAAQRSTLGRVLRRLHGGKGSHRPRRAPPLVEASPQRLAAATLLRRMSGGKALPLPAVRLGVAGQG